MLKLGRQPGERIIIGNSPNLNDNIIITVLTSEIGYTNLGIDAPRDIPIHRSEIWDKIQAGVPWRGPRVRSNRDGQNGDAGNVA